MRFFNTLTRTKEEFFPLKDNTVRIYCCGPTVYNYAHIGNYRAFLFEDVLVRFLRSSGYVVLHVMNITDVGHLVSDGDDGEDKMIRGALRENKTAWDVAIFYTDVFISEMKALNITPPTVMPRATEHIVEQITLIRELELRGYAYRITDGIYFDTSKCSSYGALARLDVKGLQEGARIGVNDEKKNLTDFALWKFSPSDVKRDMEWDSPWGVGFPGWHIECSAMSMKYLGDSDNPVSAKTFDIHCGGVDHISVHHPNEIAQTEGVTGRPMARFWLHNEWLLVGDNQKMAKSGDNFITIRSLIENGFDALDYRYFVLGAHYRSKLTFGWEALSGARQARLKLCAKMQLYKKSFSSDRSGVVLASYYDRFIDAMSDDLNTAQGLAILWELIKDTKQFEMDVYMTLLKIDEILGLNLDSEESMTIEIPENILRLVEERRIFREEKKWSESDLIRDEINDFGFIVNDLPDGSFEIHKS